MSSVNVSIGDEPGIVLCVYNSLTRKKQPLIPLVPGHLGMYVCGMTVYDACHLGHARSMVCFDVIFRTLRAAGFDVTYVRNITDVDDKIIARAIERQVSPALLAEQYIEAMHADARALNCLPPTHEPRVTEFIERIVSFIERLVAEGMAYVTAEGDVCFEVSQFDEYGKLSNKKLEHLLAGTRGDVLVTKRSVIDFVLWKHAKPDEPQWSSPWGPGRPGWHIECSAMAMETLGERFDLHGGGLDLKFPHHENEIAQTESLTHKPLANHWLHVGLLQINHEKMSKSTGNFVTIAEVLQTEHPEVIRYFLLSSHYRSPLNYSVETLASAQKSLARLYQALRDVTCVGAVDVAWQHRFTEAMWDDFNTPAALSVLFELSHAVNKTRDGQLALTLKHLGGALGLLQAEPLHFLQGSPAGLSAELIEQCIQERWHAKQAADWTKADALRAHLAAHGIELEDHTEGSVWRRV